MQGVTRHTILTVTASIFLSLIASCSDNADTPVLSGEVTLGLDFRIATRAATDSDSDGHYEEGETYENFIDIANGNYRIYFFGTDNKLIARFEPSGFVVTEGSNYRQYSVLGKAPDELVRHSDFKMVVLANWPGYNDGTMTSEATTIDDVCDADWAQYDFDPNSNLMPFYGVHEYNGVTFKPDVATILDEPVTLLRAMAKVEVILETDNVFNLSLISPSIIRYNAKGFCAPHAVYSQEDYGQGVDWENDYLKSLHLVGDKNDEDEKRLPFVLENRWSGTGSNDGTIYEKWVSYLPEYQNKGVGDAFSRIEVTINNIRPEGEKHTIYFAKYSNEGKTDNSDDNRLNIERNNIYRFNIKCTGYEFKLFLTVSDWEGLYENNFEYGDGQFTTPTSPWEDEINNDVEF